VFCQYQFFNHNEVFTVVPNVTDEIAANEIRFNYRKQHLIRLDTKFLDYYTTNPLMIQCWGHENLNELNMHDEQIKYALRREQTYLKLLNAWSQCKNTLELWVDIYELDKQGQWTIVSTKLCESNKTGGVYQLKQGQSRRIKIRIKQTVHNKFNDFMCLDVKSVISAEVGSIESCFMNKKQQQQYDSYNEHDLNRLRTDWSCILDDRKKYMNEQINMLTSKPKIDGEVEREKSLCEQMISLMEERNLIYAPLDNSGLPGAALHWTPDEGRFSIF
jgi:kinesin family protein 13